MSNQEISIQIIHPNCCRGPSTRHLLKSINISHNNNTINRLWYYLYKVDKIILSDDSFHKAINIFEEVLDDNNNYLEYTKYKIPNLYSYINYSDFSRPSY